MICYAIKKNGLYASYRLGEKWGELELFSTWLFLSKLQAKDYAEQKGKGYEDYEDIVQIKIIEVEGTNAKD